MNVRHINDGDQKDAASSKLKSIPPIGAPNAAANPEAAPMEMKSRRWMSVLKVLSQSQWNLARKGPARLVSSQGEHGGVGWHRTAKARRGQGRG